MVFDKILDTKSVINTPNTIMPVMVVVAIIVWNGFFAVPAIKIVVMVINVGKRPLQGTKKFVIVAISLSLGESMILQPITPAALHPKPIHMVNACFPWAHAFLKKLSRLNATLGKYPQSSKRVNKGKNMAIGGSITDTTQARVLYTPRTNAP